MANEQDPGIAQNPNMMATVWDTGPARPAATLNPGDVFSGRYEIVKELGAGGMGVVYLAKDSITGEEVALKLIHPSLVDATARERMIAEGVNTRKIRNPHVVAVYDVGEHDGQVFLSMEYVTGRPLRAWMAENMANRVDASLADVLKITQEILSGLAAAHREGVIHRDLKPENIMISGDPTAEDFSLKILDFGIARGLKTEAFTGSQPVMGTLYYMAPEQKTTPDAVGPSADIYSVGRMLYEMLMDVLPDGVWNAPSAQRSDVPAALDAVIQKSMQPPKHRYQTVAEFAAALDEAVQGTKAAEVASSVWKSEGGAKLLESLRELDSTINARLADGVKWLSDNLRQTEKKPEAAPPVKPESPPVGGDTIPEKASGFAGLSPKIRKLVMGAGIGVVILGVAALFEDGGTGGGGGGGGGSVPSIGGSWRMEGGGNFSVSQSGGSVQGQGMTGGWGPVEFSGPVNGTLEVYRLSDGFNVGEMRGGLAPRDGGQPGYDWQGTLVETQSGARYPILFHINH